MQHWLCIRYEIGKKNCERNKYLKPFPGLFVWCKIWKMHYKWNFNAFKIMIWTPQQISKIISNSKHIFEQFFFNVVHLFWNKIKWDQKEIFLFKNSLLIWYPSKLSGDGYSSYFILYLSPSLLCTDEVDIVLRTLLARGSPNYGGLSVTKLNIGNTTAIILKDAYV